MARDNEPAELALRANTLRAATPADARLAAWRACAPTATRCIPEALVLEEPLDVHGSPLWREGAFTAQSRAAMLVSRVLAPRPGEQRPRPLCGARRQEHASRRADRATAASSSRSRRDPRRARALAQTARRHAHGARPRRGRRRARGPARGDALRPRARRSALLGARDAPGAPRPALACQRRRDRGDAPRPDSEYWTAARRRCVRMVCLSTLRARSHRPRTSA